jgi:hypothetical protein
MRVFLGWLRGERQHCEMTAIPTAVDEDAKLPTASARPSLVSTPRSSTATFLFAARDGRR